MTQLLCANFCAEKYCFKSYMIEVRFLRALNRFDFMKHNDYMGIKLNRIMLLYNYMLHSTPSRSPDIIFVFDYRCKRLVNGRNPGFTIDYIN